MRFMVMVKANKDSEAGVLPTTKDLADMGAFNEELAKAGVMLAADGPFPETKELVAGYWIWKVSSKQEAIDWARRAPFKEGDELEIRQVFEAEDFGPPFTPELYQAIGKLTQNMIAAGVLVQTGGMQGTSGITSLKLSAGKVTVTDGPFAESKEVTGGFAIIEVESRAKAIELARQFLEIHGKIMGPSHELESEVRQMFPAADFDHTLEAAAK